MRYTRDAVAVAAVMLLLLVGCGDDADEDSVDSSMAAVEALQAELDAVKAENEQLSLALTAETGQAAEPDTRPDQEPGVDALEFAHRWGEALESGDNETLRALYRSRDDGGATIIDHMYRAVWTDADSAIDRIINNGMEFENIDLVRLEESGQVFVVEFEMNVILPPGEGPDSDTNAVPDRPTVVVVFYDLEEGRVGQSDIYFPMLSSFVTGEIGGYPERTDENETGSPRPTGWIIIGSDGTSDDLVQDGSELTESQKTAVAIIEEMTAALNRGDLEAVRSFYVDDFGWNEPDPQAYADEYFESLEGLQAAGYEFVSTETVVLGEPFGVMVDACQFLTARGDDLPPEMLVMWYRVIPESMEIVEAGFGCES